MRAARPPPTTEPRRPRPMTEQHPTTELPRTAEPRPMTVRKAAERAPTARAPRTAWEREATVRRRIRWCRRSGRRSSQRLPYRPEAAIRSTSRNTTAAGPASSAVPGRNPSWVCSGKDYICKTSSYNDGTEVRKTVLEIDLTESFQALYPTAGITRAVRREYTSTTAN